ncbi:hypothetical protein CHUAL_002734 [Chamberlinius hualienensis]
MMFEIIAIEWGLCNLLILEYANVASKGPMLSILYALFWLKLVLGSAFTKPHLQDVLRIVPAGWAKLNITTTTQRMKMVERGSSPPAVGRKRWSAHMIKNLATCVDGILGCWTGGDGQQDD